MSRKAVASAHGRLAAMGRHRPGSTAEERARMELLAAELLDEVQRIAATPGITSALLSRFAWLLLREAVKLDRAAGLWGVETAWPEGSAGEQANRP